jgi:RNA polymerase sigma factor (sigma-70 family)
MSHSSGQSPAGTSFEIFFKEDLTRLTGFLINKGASRADADDVAQEAMIAAYRHWAKASGYPHAYVRTAAERILRRKWAKDGRLRPTESRELQALVEQQRPATDLFDPETRYIFDMVRSLPDAQRQVMAWTIDGFGPKDIAKATGRTVENVRVNLHHARRAMQRMLDDYDNPKGGSGGPPPRHPDAR